MKFPHIIFLVVFFSLSTQAAEVPPPAPGPRSSNSGAPRPNSLNSPQKEYLEVLKREVARKKHECMLAFGYEPFCGCIAEKTPETTTFDLYIRTTTASPEVLAVMLDGAKPELVSTIEKIKVARDSCITSSLPPHTP